jgi:hypothetical protein
VASHSSAFAHTAFDPDGPGPSPAKLVVAGAFRRSDATYEYFVASWDGAGWAPMNAGLPQPLMITSLCVGHDPSTSAETLYATGYSDHAIFLRWGGSSWISLPPPPGPPTTYLIQSFDPDGPGPRPETIVAAGRLYFGGSPVAAWDGAAWTYLPFSLGGQADAMTTYTPPGGTPQLCISYSFYNYQAFTEAQVGIVAWDGSTPTGLLSDGCISCSARSISTLAVLNDLPGGSSLYVSGSFPSIAGVPSQNVARWDGQAWHAADAGLDASHFVTSIGVVSTAAGPTLLASAATYFPTQGSIIRWNGTSWSSPLTPLSTGALAIFPFNDGVSSAFVSGDFTVAGNNFATNIARTIGPLDLTTSTIWAPVGQTLNNSVHALAALPAASGSLASGLYAGGAFYTAGTSLAVSVARWNGTSWSALGGSVDNHVDALTIASINGPMALYAGGKFTHAAGLNTPHIARWNGSTWSVLGAGLNDRVECLTTFNGSLIAGGAFTASGSTTLNHIARWDGATWWPLGTGTNDEVKALAVFNDGSGDALYAGGTFYIAGGTSVSRIARWNGSSWSSLGLAFNGPVQAITSYDDGTGPALYAAGIFGTSGLVSVPYIARWNGSLWLPLGQGLDGEVDSLVALDPDGPGPARARLVAGGRFTEAGGQPIKYAAQWNGTAWSALGTGVDDGPVLAMATLDADGSGGQPPSLFLGGDFRNVGGASSPYIAEFRACTCYPNCDSSATLPVLNINDFQCFLNKFAANDPYANCDHSTTPPTLNINDFQCFLNAFAAGCS